MPSEKQLTLPQQEDHLYRVLSSERFLHMEGLGNEVAHFVYDYDPSKELEVEQMVRRLKNRLRSDHGINVLDINLYNLCIDLLKARNVWDRVLAAEPTMKKGDFLKLLQNMLDPQQHLASAIKMRVTEEDPTLLFLTGIGQVFPFIRSHTVLNNQ